MQGLTSIFLNIAPLGRRFFAWGLLLLLFVFLGRSTPSAAESSATTRLFLPITTGSSTTPPPSSWLASVNSYRAGANLPPVRENATLSAGAWQHARYTVKNNTVLHTQDPLNPWYTLEGLRAAQSSNVVATGNLTQSDPSAIDFWMQAPFHALVILEPALHEVGYGSYREASTSGIQMAAALDVYQGMGAIPSAVRFPIQWPASGSSAPLRLYGGGETIDPLVSCPGYSAPSGLPILLQIGAGEQTPNVTAHSFKQGNTPLEHCLFDETSYRNPNSSYQEIGRSILDVHDAIVLIPRSPLSRGATYTVSITANGQSHTWSFTVSQEARN